MRRHPFLSALAACAAVTTLAAAATSSTQAAPGDADGRASVSELAERVSPPAARPEVYLAFHGSEGLLGATDWQWAYSRAHLDGLWGNPFVPPSNDEAGRIAAVDRAAALARKVETRKLITEHPIAEGGRCIALRDDNYARHVEAWHSDIRFDRVAVALYAAENPNCWGEIGGYPGALATYRREGYGEVYAFFQPQNRDDRVYASAFPTIQAGSTGRLAYDTAGGIALECPIDACTDPTFGAPFLDAIRDARARDVPFVWFTGYTSAYGIGTSGWLERIQRTYRMVEEHDLWRQDDKIVVINYHGQYPALPERLGDGSPADTTTGVLAWLLEQRPLTS